MISRPHLRLARPSVSRFFALRPTRGGLSALVLFTMLLSMLTFIAPEAQASDTVTSPSGNVTFQLTRDRTGSGFGTSDQCFINSSNGYSPGDNSPDDDYVCTNDSVAYGIHWTSNTTSAPETFTVSYGFSGAMTSDLSQLQNFCTNGGKDVFSGVVQSAGNGMVTCQVTTKPGASATGSYELSNQIPRNSDTTVQNITGFTMQMGGQTAQAPETHVLSANVIDERLGRSQSYTVVTIDGQKYVRYALWMNLVQPRDIGEYSKGEIFGVGFNVRIDATSLPDGTLFTKNTTSNNANASVDLVETSPGSKILVASRANPQNFSPGWVNGEWAADAATFVNIPVSALPNDTQELWPVHITDAKVFPAGEGAANVAFPDAFNGAGDPGLGQPSSFNTDPLVPGLNPQSAGYPNDNWASISYAQAEIGDLLSKYDIANNSTSGGSFVRPGESFVSHVTVNSTYLAEGTLSLCDAWSISTAYSTDYSPQHLDTTKDIKIVDANGSALPSSAYQVSYAFSPSSSTGMGTCSEVPDDAWSSDPSAVAGGEPDLLRITIKNADLTSGTAAYAYHAEIPFKAGPADEYPNYTSTRALLPDRASISWNDSGWQGSAPAWAYVTGPDASPQSAITNAEAGASSAWAPSLPTFYAGSTYSTVATMGSSWFDTRSSDTDLAAYGKLSISSCALNPEVVPLTGNGNPPDAAAVTLVSAPDYGADGLPCTADDVSGWQYRVDFGNKPNPSDPYPSTTGAVSVNYSLPAYVPPGMTFTSTAEVIATHFREGSSYGNLSTKSTPILSAKVTGQSKVADQPRVQVGDSASWTSTIFNSLGQSGGAASFIDVLPYLGDGRGTTASESLQSVSVSPVSGVTRDQIWVTSANPSTISRNAGDASNEPATNSAWCQLSNTSCLGGKEITAYQIRLDSFPDGYVGAVRVSGSTTGDSVGQALVNNLGSGVVAGLGTIAPTSNQPVALYLSKITGSVYEDTSSDGAHQASENLVPNYTVNLLDSSGHTIKTTTTDSSGGYTFDELVAGAYSVKIADPTGQYSGVTQAYKTVKPDGSAGVSSGDISLGRDSTVGSVDFGLNPVDKIGITKSGEAIDTNNDGSVDASKYTFTVTNMGGRQLTNVKVNDSLLSAAGIGVTCAETTLAVGASTTCHSDSSYSFTSADYDRGYVDNTATSTGTNPDGGPVKSAPSTARVEVPEPTVGKLSGTVYADSNSNGSQNSGEKGIPTYQVVLISEDTGEQVGATTTNAQGYYEFDSLPKGNYRVRIADVSDPYTGVTQAYTEVVLSGLAHTSVEVSLTRGGSVEHIDFGLNSENAKVEGTSYGDENDNGHQDPGEPMLPGQPVALVLASGALGDRNSVVAYGETDANGHYVFEHVPAGSYKVVANAPEDPYDGVTQAYQLHDTSGKAGVRDQSFPDLPITNNFDVAKDSTVSNVDFGYKPVGATPTPDPTDTPSSSSSSSTSSSDSSSSSSSTTSTTSTTDSSSPSSSSSTSTSSSSSSSSSSTTSTSSTPVVPGRVSGRVYEDQNDDGSWKSGEPGVQGWRVTLVEAKGQEIAAVDAGADGSYVFGNIVPGEYHVVVKAITNPWVGISQAYKVVKVDGTATTNSGAFTVPAGGEVKSVDFGFLRRPEPSTTTTPTTTSSSSTPGGSTTSTPGTSTSTTSTSSSTSSTTTPSNPVTPTGTPTVTPSSPTSTPSGSSSTSKSSTTTSSTKPGTSGGSSTTTGKPSTPASTSPPSNPGKITPTGTVPAASSTTPGHSRVAGGTGGASPKDGLINTGDPGAGSTSTLPMILGGLLLAGGVGLLGLLARRRRRR